MRRVSIFLNRDNQSVRLPKDMSYPGVTELIIEREGEVTTLRPARPTWRSFLDLPPVEDADDFLRERPEVMDQDRFGWMKNEAPADDQGGDDK